MKFTPLIVVGENDLSRAGAHYDASVREVVRALWRGKWLMLAGLVASLAVAIAVLKHIGASYSSEAIIQIDFGLDGAEPGGRGVSVDASALVDSAARVIRARSTADSVAALLRLEVDPRYQVASFPSRALAGLRAYLGYREAPPTPHDRAVDAIMRQVRVSSDPRSYVIVVSATAARPAEAAILANAVAAVYLRTHARALLAAAWVAARRELAETALTYGPRHPAYERARLHLEQIDARLAAMQHAADRGDSAVLQSLIPAREILKPSGPNVPVVLAVAVLLALVAGTALAWFSVRWDARPRTGRTGGRR